MELFAIRALRFNQAHHLKITFIVVCNDNSRGLPQTNYIGALLTLVKCFYLHIN